MKVIHCDRCDKKKIHQMPGWRKFALDVEGATKAIDWKDLCPSCLEQFTIVWYEGMMKGTGLE